MNNIEPLINDVIESWLHSMPVAHSGRAKEEGGVVQYKEQAIDPPDGPIIVSEREFLARTTDSDVDLHVDVRGGHVDLTYQAEFRLTSVEWSDETETWQNPELVAVIVGKFGEEGYCRIPASFLESDVVRKINNHLAREVIKGKFIATEEI